MDLSRAASLALGLAFLWAGVAKLGDRRWPDAARAFGVPVAVAGTIAPLELVLGAALVTLRTRVPAGIAALVLVGYTAILVRAVRSDAEAPACACFGGLTARPVSWRTVARNAVLLALAAAAMAG